MSEEKERHCWVLKFWGFFFPNLGIYVAKSQVPCLRVLDYSHLFLTNLKKLLKNKKSKKSKSSVFSKRLLP